MPLKIKSHPFFIKLFNWEYWPFGAVYGPILPIYGLYSLRAGSFFFFSTSNPTIKNAGFAMESKFEIDAIVPEKYRPVSVYFEPGFSPDELIATIKNHHFSYPLIIKPDIGGKGVGVQKVTTEAMLIKTAQGFPVPFIIQPFINFPNEIGLFYVKMPGAATGKITGIVRKEFLSVTGNGVDTIYELLQKNQRYILQLAALKKMMGKEIDRVIPNGITEILVPYGNHARGSLFLDDSHLITPELESTFNKICGQINQFYFGRMDIKYNTWDELVKGENFSIIELNGAGSEPTHIYDPRHSLFFAWKEIIKHWKLLWQVSYKSKQLHQLKYMKTSEGLFMLNESRKYNLIGKKSF